MGVLAYGGVSLSGRVLSSPLEWQLRSFLTRRPRFVALLTLLAGLSLATASPLLSQTLSSVTVSPSSVVSGALSTGTVTLSANAPTGGITVSLSANSGASVPASAVVPSGTKTATFDVVTTGVAAGTVTVTAIYSGVTKTASLTVTAPALSTLVLDTPSALGGAVHPTGTVTLTGTAPSGGTTVSLSNTVTGSATVPAGVIVPAGSSTATFSVTTLASAGSPVITATLSSTNKTATLVVTTTPAVATVTLAQTSVKAGTTTTATVALNGPAPAGGASVTLTSATTTVATVPTSVAVPAGSWTGTYTVTAVAGASGSSVLTASYGGKSATATVTVTSATTNYSVTLSKSNLVGTGTATGTITLNGPAPTGGASVTVGASPGGIVTVSPAAVSITAGNTTGTFSVTGIAQTATATATITTTYASTPKTATISVNPSAVPISVTFSPTSVTGGVGATGTVTLSAAAPTGNRTVSLYSSNATVASVPATVVVNSGATSATFPVTTTAQVATTQALVIATAGGISASGALRVSAPLPSTVSCNPTSVTAGTTSQGTVTLTGAAPTAGAIVRLVSSNTSAATVPATVNVSSAGTSANFTITTIGTFTGGSVAIQATRETTTASASLTVNAPPITLSTISASPNSVPGGQAVTGTVTLSGPAPTGGATVTLSSNNSLAASVPANVLVIAGTTSQTFQISTTAQPSTANVTITGNYNGSQVAPLAVNVGLSSVALAPGSVPGGQQVTGTVTLSGTAPTGGALLTLTSSKTSVATVLANVTVPQGAVSATFNVNSQAVASTDSTTITATYGAPKTASLTVTPGLSALALNPLTVAGGVSSAGSVTLSGPAPSGGAQVALQSSNTQVATVLASTTVVAGQTSAAFTVTTVPVSTQTNVTITGTYGGAKTKGLTVALPSLVALSIAPTSIPGGTTAVGTVTLNAPAGPSGTAVTLSSNKTAVATVAATVGVPAGLVSATFTINGAAVTADGTATITATLAGTNMTADIAVTRAVGSLSGTVVDAVTGFPLPGVSVQLTSDPGNQVGTDLYGHFLLTGVPAGSQTVNAILDQHAGATSSAVTVVLGQTATVPPFSMTPNPVTISGTVVDPDNGSTPLAGVVVTDVSGLHTATTDGNGHFVMSGILPGFTQLVAQKDGYRPDATGWFAFSAGSTPSQDLGLRAVWSLDQPGLAEGTVRDSGGNPVPGVTVSAVGVPGVSATTGSDGKYGLTLPAGFHYVLQAAKAGFRRTFSKTLSASAGSTPWHLAQDFMLPLSSGTGTLNLLTFEPVSRTPWSSNLWFYTPGGIYHSPVPTSGSRAVSAIPAGPVWDCLGVRMLPENGALSVRCTGDLVISTGSPRWAAAGIVANQYTGEPVPNATVTFVQGGNSTPVATDANGLFSYKFGPVGDYSVVATAPGFVATDPWTFTAADNPADGNYYGAALWPNLPQGTLDIPSLPDGSTVTTALTQLAVTLTTTRPGDSLVSASASVWPGGVVSQKPTYSPDGMSVTIALMATAPTGEVFVTVNASTQSGTGLSLQRTINIQAATEVSALDFTPNPVSGGTQATGRLILLAAAPTGGAVVGLSSSDPATASIPASVTVPAGETTATFPVVTVPVSAAKDVLVEATFQGSSQVRTLTVTHAGSLWGGVVDSTTGFPLHNVAVALASEPTNWVQTDVDGRYLISNVPAGSQSLSASRGDYVTGASPAVTVLSGQTTAVPAVQLDPIGATIKGQVVDPDNASIPLSGVAVTLGRSGRTATTGADGMFQFDNVPPGIEVVAAAVDGFRPWFLGEQVGLTPAGTADYGQISIPRETESFPQGIAHGTVRDSGGQPLPGVTVRAVGAGSATTGANGQYSIPLARGAYFLVAEKGGYRQQVSRLRAGAYRYATNWQSFQDFALATSQATATLTLTTTDEGLGTPRAGWGMLYETEGVFGVETPSSGTRTFPIAPDKVFGIDVVPEVAPGASLSLDMGAQATFPASSPSWVFSAILWDRATARPIVGASLQLANASAGFTTTLTSDAHGRLIFSGGPLGDYLATLSTPGHVTVPPWVFTAEEGRLINPHLQLDAIGDDGTLTIASPLDGGVVAANTLTVDCMASLPVPGDYVVNATAWITNGTVTSQAITFAIDGRSFSIGTSLNALNGPQTLTVEAVTSRGATLTATRAVQFGNFPPITGFTLNPQEVVGGTPSTATITFQGTIPAGGASLALTSSKPAAQPPAALGVPEGAPSATVSIPTVRSVIADTAVLTATLGSSTATATLMVDPSDGILSGSVVLASNGQPVADANVTIPGRTESATTLSNGTFALTTLGGTVSLTVTKAGVGSAAAGPFAVVPGQTASVGTIQLLSPATITGTVINASGGTPLAGATVTVTGTASNASTDTNGVFTIAGLAPGSVTLTVTFTGFITQVTSALAVTSGENVSAGTIALTPVRVSGLTSVPTVAGGAPLSLTVLLNGPAPVGGLPITFGSTDGAIQPPAPGVVDAGTNSKAFVATTAVVTAPKDVSVTASGGGSSASKTVTVKPDGVDVISFNLTTIVGGANLSGTVTLTQAAPIGGRTVTLTSGTPSVVTVPASVFVAAGALSAGFNAASVAVTTPQTVLITAAYGTTSATVSISVQPFGVSSVQFSSPTGSQYTVNVSLNAPAPSGGVDVALSATGGFFQVFVPYVWTCPSSKTLHFPQGSSFQYDIVNVSWQPAPVSLSVTGTYGSTAASATTSVSGSPFSFSINPSSVKRGQTATGTVSFGALGAPKQPVTLVSGDPSMATVPAQVPWNLSSGCVLGAIPVTVPATASTGLVTITATVEGVSAQASLAVLPSVLTGFTVRPSIATSGAACVGTITLDSPAPPGGGAYSLQSSDPLAITLPGTVLVPAGSTQGTITFIPLDVATRREVTITVSDGTNTKAAPVSVLKTGAVTVTGRILDGTIVDWEKPVPNALVVATGETNGTTTDALGTFTTYHDPGTFTLVASVDGFVSQSTSLTGSASQVVSSGDLNLHKVLTVSNGSYGTVAATPGGAGVPGVTVSLAGYDGTVTSNASGVFSLGPVLKVYRLTMSGGGLPATTRDVPRGTNALGWDSPDLGKVVMDGSTSPSLTSVSFNPAVVLKGQNSNFTMNFTSALPVNSEVALHFDDPANSGLSVVSVNTPSVDWVTTSVSSSTYVLQVQAIATPPATPSITAYYGGVRKRSTLAIGPGVTVSGLEFGPNIVSGGGSTSMTVYLTSPQPTATVVPITSWNQNCISNPPATVTVQPGWNRASVTLVAGETGSLAECSVTATLNGTTKGATLFVNPPVPNQVALVPSSVTSGGISIATITIDRPAPSGGVTLTLDANGSSAASIQASVVVPAGQSSVSVPVAATTVLVPQTATIRASGQSWLGGYVLGNYQVSPSATMASTPLTITPGLFASLTFSPATVSAGSPSTGTLSTTGPAPVGGLTVSLASGTPTVATVPTAVLVPAGQASATFSVTTLNVSFPTTVAITASAAGQNLIGNLIVNPLVPSALTFAPSSVRAGSSATATLTISGPAPTGGLSVSLSSGNTSVATVPANAVVPQGQAVTTFPVSTQSGTSATNVAITAAAGGQSLSANLGIVRPPQTISGLAPGFALPGDGGIVLYGSGFTPSTQVWFTGPVYSTTNLQVPLCGVQKGDTCPSVTVSATLAADQKSLTFAIPPAASPGAYQVYSQGDAGFSTNSVAVMVDDPVKTQVAVTPADHGSASRIWPGQVVNGTFVANGDPSGATGDYNFFYFMSTAGSRVSVSLDRTDSTLPWEHPDSIEPSLLLIAPDGFVYENLVGSPVSGTNLNARINHAILPSTGLYIVQVSTSHGFGPYGLTFQVNSQAPAPIGQRVIPVNGQGATVPLNQLVSASAGMLDPRGYPISGAAVTPQLQNGADDSGTVAFQAGTTAYTTLDGYAIMEALVTSPGKVEFGPVLSDATLASSVVLQKGADGQMTEMTVEEIPRYQPVGHAAYAPLGVDMTGALKLSVGPIKRLPKETLLGRTSSQGAPSSSSRSASWLAQANQPPVTARTGVALKPQAIRQKFRPESTTTCFSGTFTVAGVNATVKAPFTVTLTDVTPPAGQRTPTGLLTTTDGIHGYRVTNEVRLRLQILDASLQEPTYPVLVTVSLAGTDRGTLILDPTGLKIRCKEARFVWHERDAQGNPLPQKNEEIGYELGTRSAYVGAIPDPQNAGQVKPVWGTTEALGLQIAVPEADGSQDPSKMVSLTFPVHPEPWKPDHFGGYDTLGQPSTDQFPFWAGNLTHPDGMTVTGTLAPRYVSRDVEYEAYYLYDQYENTTFGYQNASITPPAAPITATFTAQTTTGPDFAGYTLDTRWSNDPAWPTGPSGATVSVNYPDASPDWTPGQVTKDITYLFDSGSAHVLARHRTYDLIRPDASKGINDGTFPISVSPGQGEGLPTADDKTGARLVLLTWNGMRVPGELPKPEPIPTGLRMWSESQFGGWFLARTDPDPTLEVTDTPSFKMSLIDGTGKPAPDGAFKVHRCPRFEHFQPPTGCSVPPIQSDSSGAILSVTVNGDGATTGYLGIELTKAPVKPGTYYVVIEAVGNTYKVRRESDWQFDGSVVAGDSKGAFALCTVNGGEFLDENFQRVRPFPVQQPTQAYVRVISQASGSTVPLTVTSTLPGGEPVGSASVTATRVGASSVFLAPFTLLPDGYAAAQPARRLGTLAGDQPELEVPLGLGPLSAKDLGGFRWADGLANFQGAVRLRFLRRDAPDSCYSGSYPGDDICLTSPPGPSTLPGTTQETAIRLGFFQAGRVFLDSCPAGQTCAIRLHMEVVGLLADVVNPFDVMTHSPSPRINPLAMGGLKFREIPNQEYWDDRAAHRGPFFKGDGYDSAIPENGGDITALRGEMPSPLELTLGRATFRLYSVASPRFDSQSHAVTRTQTVGPVVGHMPYTTTLKAGLTFLPSGDPTFQLDGIPLTINQWVDERTYSRNRTNNASGTSAWSTQANQTSDWLEMRAQDTLADANSGANSEVEAVYRSPSRVVEDWTVGYSDDDHAYHATGIVDEVADLTVIRIPPYEWWYRYEIPGTEPVDSTYHGLLRSVPQNAFLSFTLFHEARHCWQFQLRQNGRSDNDGDFLVQSPPPSSPEIADAPYPTNPEFSFLGDGVDATTDDRALQNAMWREALEHNSDRFAIGRVGVGLTSASVNPLSLSLGPSAGTLTLSAKYQGVVETGPRALTGRLLRVETAISCTGPFIPVENAYGNCLNTHKPCATGADGAFSATGLVSGQAYRFTLINPKEYTGSEVMECVSIP